MWLRSYTVKKKKTVIKFHFSRTLVVLLLFLLASCATPSVITVNAIKGDPYPEAQSYAIVPGGDIAESCG